ncbi:hypothetical protein AAVH_31361 [Aphelenchoides avenae]|nr:hypothetical protein AAVH_31361 [Aphelenchus avenae]
MPMLEFLARELKCSEYSVEGIIQGPEGPRVITLLQTFRVFGKLGEEFVIIFPSEFDGRKLVAVHRKPNAQWDMIRVGKSWELAELWIHRGDAVEHLKRKEGPQRTSFPPPHGAFIRPPSRGSGSAITPPPGPFTPQVKYGPALQPVKGASVNLDEKKGNDSHLEAATQTDNGTWIPSVQQPELYLRVKFSISGMEVLDLHDMAKAIENVDREGADEPSQKKPRKDSSLEEELDELDETDPNQPALEDTDPKLRVEATKSLNRSKAAAEKAASMTTRQAERERKAEEQRQKQQKKDDTAGFSGSVARVAR